MRQIIFFALVLFSISACVAEAADRATIFDLTSKSAVLNFEHDLAELNRSDPKKAKLKAKELVSYLRRLSQEEIEYIKTQLCSGDAESESAQNIQIKRDCAILTAMDLILSHIFDAQVEGLSLLRLVDQENAKFHRRANTPHNKRVSFDALTNFISLAEHVTGKPIKRINLTPFKLVFLPVTIVQLEELEKIYVSPEEAKLPLDDFAPRLVPDAQKNIPKIWKPQIIVLNPPNDDDATRTAAEGHHKRKVNQEQPKAVEQKKQSEPGPNKQVPNQQKKQKDCVVM